jgi:hypothetical protein
MGKRNWVLIGVIILIPLFLNGCGFYETRDQIRSAEKSLSDLKAAGGDKLVPYEYCSAETYLGISKMFYDKAQYKTAGEFVGRSKSASEAGLAEVKKKR